MRIRLTPLFLLVAAATVGAQGAKKTDAKKPEAAKPALKWGPAPAVFPKGAKMAVVSGDPGKAGTFNIQLQMPDGYKIMPHFHPTDESVEVLKGSFRVGMGDKLDLAKTNTMKVGDKGTIKANDHHYAVAKGATTVSVTAMGPFAMTYVNAADDPTAKTAKTGKKP